MKMLTRSNIIQSKNVAKNVDNTNLTDKLAETYNSKTRSTVSQILEHTVRQQEW